MRFQANVQDQEVLSGTLMKNTPGGRLHRMVTNFSAGTPLQSLAWRRRIFELRPAQATLVYWQRDETHVQGLEPDGQLSMAAVDEVAVNGCEVLLHFAIPQATKADSKNARTELRLRADSPKDAETWGAAVHAVAAARLSAELPPDWDVYAMLRKTEASAARCVAKLPQTGRVLKAVQRLIDHSFICKRTRDRRTMTEMPMRLEVVELKAIHNVKAWIEYRSARDAMATENERPDKPPGCELDPPVRTSTVDDHDLDEVAGMREERANEQWLFHGAPSSAVQGITDENWRLDLAGTNAGVLYGNGIYLAECASKADEYAKQDESGLCQMLLCRASLGRVLVEASKNPEEDVFNLCKTEYDSMCGDRWRAVGSYREFVVYSATRVYPAYIITYRRVMQQELFLTVNDEENYDPGCIVPYIAHTACTHQDKLVRYRILLFLKGIGHKIVPVLLNGLLNHRRWPVRRVCAAAIGQLCDEELVGTDHAILEAFGGSWVPAMKSLTESLKDWHESVQKAAAVSLGQLAKFAVVEKSSQNRKSVRDALSGLVSKVRGHSEKVRMAAIKALGCFGALAVPTMPVLIQCLDDSSEEVKLASLGAMSSLGPSAVSAVLALMKILSIAGETKGAKAQAAIALGNIGKPALRAGLALTAALKDEDASLRAAAATALGSFGRAAYPAVEQLSDMDVDPSEDARKAACKTLGGLLQFDKDGAVARHLSKFLKNEITVVREMALAAFVAFANAHPSEAKQTALPAARLLQEALTDEDMNVRKLACYALGKCGVTSAIPRLRDRLKDRHEVVSMAANTALMALGDRIAPTADELVSLGHYMCAMGKKRISSTDELAPGDYEILEKLRREGPCDLKPAMVNPHSNGLAARCRRPGHG